MKKGIFLLSTLILLIIGWSAGWFFVAGKVETVIKEAKSKLADKGKDFECANQQVNGYPFRISLNCDAIQYADEVTGITFEAGELKSAAQAYQPTKAIVELKSPANLTLGNSESFRTSWTSMRSSMNAGLSGPENLSVHGKEVVLIPTTRAEHTIAIEDMQFHGRQIGENDINLAVNLIDAKSANAIWPTFDLNTLFLVSDTYRDIMNRTSIIRVAKTKGLKGKIERFQYMPKNGGALEITGPAEVNRQGQLSGKFDVTIRELPKLLSALGESFPENRENFAKASAAISLISQKTGKNEITLPIAIQQGKVKLGFFTLMTLPPLF